MSTLAVEEKAVQAHTATMKALVMQGLGKASLPGPRAHGTPPPAPRRQAD